jgi:hypothetical protein
MSLWTLIKLAAALCVLAVMAFTGMLAYHVNVRPLGGVFTRIIPTPVRAQDGQSDADFAKMLDTAEVPEIDPGLKVFQKAHELLALGKPAEAREKLTTIVNVFPASACAPAARRIVGEMNLDEILSTTHMAGKTNHIVKSGDSFLGIAAKYKTGIDCIMHLNSMMELRRIQPGDELILMPLEFRVIIDSRRKTLSLWDGGRSSASIRPFISRHRCTPLAAPRSVPSPQNCTASDSNRRARTTVVPTKSSTSPNPRKTSAAGTVTEKNPAPFCFSAPKTWRNSTCSPASATKWRSVEIVATSMKFCNRDNFPVTGLDVALPVKYPNPMAISSTSYPKKWKSGKTTVIRVPEKLAETVIELARRLDESDGCLLRE